MKGRESSCTSCKTHETRWGIHYFDSSTEIPVFPGLNDSFSGNVRAAHNRSDVPAKKVKAYRKLFKGKKVRADR